MTHYKLLGPIWSRAFRCLWILEELGLNYELVASVRLGLDPQVREYVRSGKVPVLLEYEDDSSDADPTFVLYESVAINNYLAEKVPSRGLIPLAGTRERALYDQTVCCILSEIDAQGLWIHRKHEALGDIFGRIPAAVDHAAMQFARMNKQIAQPLQKNCGPYLLGQQFTAADILYVHCLDWAQAIGWHKWPSELDAYLKLCRQRPAYQAAKKQQEESSSGSKL